MLVDGEEKIFGREVSDGDVEAAEPVERGGQVGQQQETIPVADGEADARDITVLVEEELQVGEELCP